MQDETLTARARERRRWGKRDATEGEREKEALTARRGSR
jgi:hypothetical protein